MWRSSDSPVGICEGDNPTNQTRPTICVQSTGCLSGDILYYFRQTNCFTAAIPARIVAAGRKPSAVADRRYRIVGYHKSESGGRAHMSKAQAQKHAGPPTVGHFAPGRSTPERRNSHVHDIKTERSRSRNPQRNGSAVENRTKNP